MGDFQKRTAFGSWMVLFVPFVKAGVMKNNTSFLYRNGLGITVLVFMVIFWATQLYTGWLTNNAELREDDQKILHLSEYIQSGHFIQATFENWESEFLQMTMYVVPTIFLQQKGSVESRKLKGEKGAEEEEKEDIITVRADSPWPVKKGGLWLCLYKYSLSIAFIALFSMSFVLHFIGSLKNNNDEQLRKGAPAVNARQYIHNARFWFESFQNWQSEFLAVAAIVLLTIWLRQHGSPESKPVSAPDSENGTINMGYG
jgi:hypothetical protein